MAVPLGAGPGLKPFACLRFLRRPEGVLPRIEIRGFHRQGRHTGWSLVDLAAVTARLKPCPDTKRELPHRLVPPTRVFLAKRLQSIENKGNGHLEARKEALSYWKH